LLLLKLNCCFIVYPTCWQNHWEPSVVFASRLGP